MKRWLTLMVLAAAIVGCDRFQPARTPTRTAAPTSVPAPTETPSLTSLPPTLTLAPTDTPTLTSASAPTDTPAPTNTPTATATTPRVRFTPTPEATATTVATAQKYSAPILVGPGAGDTRLDGKDDLLFKWKPVGNLGPNECYLVTVQVINITDPVQRYGQGSFLAQDTCNSAASSGNLQFTLRKRNPPSYQGLVADASQNVPSSEYKVRWWVTVVIADGTPLSPPSAQFEFTLESP
jgi:hypothetical protein